MQTSSAWVGLPTVPTLFASMHLSPASPPADSRWPSVSPLLTQPRPEGRTAPCILGRQPGEGADCRRGDPRRRTVFLVLPALTSDLLREVWLRKGRDRTGQHPCRHGDPSGCRHLQGISRPRGDRTGWASQRRRPRSEGDRTWPACPREGRLNGLQGTCTGLRPHGAELDLPHRPVCCALGSA